MSFHLLIYICRISIFEFFFLYHFVKFAKSVNTLRYMTQQCNQIMNPADATICWISWSAPGFFFTWSCCPDWRSVVSFHRFFAVNYSEEKSHSPSSCLLSASQSSLTAPQTFLHVEGPQV